MHPIDAVLDALFLLAGKMRVRTIDLVIERDPVGIAVGAAASFVERDGVVELVPLPLHVVRACSKRLTDLSERSHVSVGVHGGEIMLPHPADARRFEIRVLLSERPPEDVTEDLRARVARAAAACHRPDTPRLTRGEHDDEATKAVERALDTMLAEGWNKVMLSPGQTKNWTRIVARLRELARVDLEGAGELDYDGIERAYLRVRVSEGVFDPEWGTYDEAWIAMRRLPVPEGTDETQATASLGDELLERVLSAPGDRAVLEVYADWLTQQNDPRGEEILRAAPYGPPDPASWLGSLAGVVEQVALDDTLGAEVVVDAVRALEVDWTRLATERHWRVVRCLWLRSDMPRSHATTLLERAPLTSLRHLVLEDDGFVASASRTPCADRIEKLTLVCRSYNPRLAELERALSRGGFPKLERFSMVFPPREDGRLSVARAPFRYPERSIAVETLHVSADQPLHLLERLRRDAPRRR